MVINTKITTDPTIHGQRPGGTGVADVVDKAHSEIKHII